MTHQEIENHEIVERYVRHQLSLDDRRAFQEHFFACDACFNKVQMTARFVAGVRQASVGGGLAQAASATPAVATSTAGWANWLKPAFALATAASLGLAILLGWLLLSQMPKLRDDARREREMREQLERDQQELEKAKQQGVERATSELEREREALAQEKSEREKLQKQLAELTRNQAPPAAGAKNQPAVNAPIVILEAVRDSQTANQLTLPEHAASATLWVEVEPGNRFTGFNLQLITSGGRLVTSVKGAKRNAYGAVAVNLPASLLRVGKYIVKLYGLEPGKRELVGEYNLTVSQK